MNNATTIKDQVKPLPLKKIAQPFLLNYHPDRLASATEVVRTTNLVAVQTLNGLIDCIESIYDRAHKGLSHQQHGRLEIQPMYSVEFMVPKNNGNDRRSIDSGIMYTRRSVEVAFSESERLSAQTVDRQGLYSIPAATLIRNKTRRNIIKLLNIAELDVPHGADRDDKVSFREHALGDHFLYDELDLDNHGFHTNQRFTEWQEPTELESSRREFMKKMDWKKHRRMYYDALEDMKRDLYTEGLIGAHAERKEMFLSRILSRVRVEGPQSSAETDCNPINPIQQLITIRRLSGLLLDNFERLEIEEFGRLWETLTIVLIPSWNLEPPPLKEKQFQKTRRKHTGFKFTVHSDNSVTVYIPVDFMDEDFLHEMKSNLADFYDICVSSGGIDDYFPSYYKEWISDARSRGSL
jgi:hypothetical protein